MKQEEESKMKKAVPKPAATKKPVIAVKKPAMTKVTAGAKKAALAMTNAKK